MIAPDRRIGSGLSHEKFLNRVYQALTSRRRDFGGFRFLIAVCPLSDARWRHSGGLIADR
jgi:hypothetical protein